MRSSNPENSLLTQPLRLVRYNPTNRADFRLFCFPYAGGGLSVFQQWPNFLPPEVEVCSVELPGRDMRMCQPAITHMSALVEQVMLSLKSSLDRPFAFFGHSMGSLIAFELARALRREILPQPAILFVSGHRAAHLPESHPPIHQLPDKQFLEEMQRLCSTPQEFLSNNDLVELFLPTLRADFQLCETYQYVPDEPLDSPIAAFGGASDDAVSSDELEAWHEMTRSSFRLRLIQGSHLFIHTSTASLLRAIKYDLQTLLLICENPF